MKTAKTAVLLVYFSLLCVIGAHTQIAFADDDFFSVQGTDTEEWNQPVGLMFSPSGDKLFVWEKAGIVYVCHRIGSDYIKQTQAVIDISAEVGCYDDLGLTGFALDPNFAANGRIYLSYVVDRCHLLNIAGTPDQPGATIGRITRYTTSTSAGVLTANTSDRTVLLGQSEKTGIPILHKSHGTGSLVFAADGTLLASMGDGASYDGADEGPGTPGYLNTYYQQALDDDIIRDDENVGVWRSQMLTSLNGKVLRIDPQTGSGIASNPFYEPSSPESTKSKIWALGLRNPFRISLKPGGGSPNPLTGHIGELFIADVGFGEWEELNIANDKGMNFGWPKYEGYNSTIGIIYNGNNPNPELPFPPGTPSEFCGGRTPQYVWFHEALREDNEAKDSRVYYCNDPGGVLLGEGPRYIHARPILDWLHAATGGPNARVGIFNPAGVADKVSIGTPASGVTGNLFNGNASTGGIWYTGGSEYYPTEYANTFFFADFGGQWIKRATFDNGTLLSVNDFATNTVSVCMVENPSDGTIFYVDYGESITDANIGRINKIKYGGNKPPVAKIMADQYFTAASTLTVNFDGSGSDDPDPSGGIASYAWDFDDGATSTSSNPTHVFNNSTGLPKQYNVKLTVTDIGGATDEEIFIVSLNNTPPQVTITKPVKNSNYAVGGDFPLELEANVIDNENNIVEYEWQVFMEHNEHAHAGPPIYQQEATTTASGVGCDGGDDYNWLARLKVSDNAGLFTIDTSRIYPNCTILPIVLHKFSVTQNGTDNLVKWTTELESNIEYFEVERSPDGIDFSSVNRQKASNAPGPNHYSFADNRFLSGVNYYRLKIVEHSSIIRYSVVIRTVADDEKSVLKVVPNPVVGNFSLTYWSREKDRVVLQIRDITGRLLHTLKEDVNKGQNVIYMQNLPNWNSGIYFISVQNKNEIKQAKFIKAR